MEQEEALMATLRRWNEATREYEPYEVPDHWKLLAYSNDMDEPCNCALCGRELAFGECYTSFQVHTPAGFGYMVCEACHFSIEVPQRMACRG